MCKVYIAQSRSGAKAWMEIADYLVVGSVAFGGWTSRRRRAVPVEGGGGPVTPDVP